MLQDYANKLCAIFVGWRLAVHEETIPRLIEHGEGTVHIDVQTGDTTIDDSAVPIPIAEELRPWFAERAQADRVPAEHIRSVRLAVRFRAAETRSKRGKVVRELSFSCWSRIETDETQYEGCLDPDESWSRHDDGYTCLCT